MGRALPSISNFIGPPDASVYCWQRVQVTLYSVFAVLRSFDEMATGIRCRRPQQISVRTAGEQALIEPVAETNSYADFVGPLGIFGYLPGPVRGGVAPLRRE